MLDTIKKAQETIERACRALDRQINVMEVCGTHTVSIFRSGIRTLLPAHLRLLSGPGCPVCVTDQGYLDVVLRLADRDDCLIATYGDMIRVPGTHGSLESCQGKARVHVVLSSDDALQLAREHPDKTVVFVAVGFETTTPATAVVVKEAREQGIENFCILSAHKLVVPAMKALVGGMNHKIDAFLCPGHVSVIMGYGTFADIVEEYRRPCVVAGFEPVQIIQGLAEICNQLATGKPQLASVYSAVVTQEGNRAAQQIVNECFTPTDGYWRGLGNIPDSTLKLRESFSAYDGFLRFDMQEIPGESTQGCRCGEVLCGLMDPTACGLFGQGCTPRKPVGPCMVSSEGACAAWYKYGHKEKASS